MATVDLFLEVTPQLPLPYFSSSEAKHLVQPTLEWGGYPSA